MKHRLIGAVFAVLAAVPGVAAAQGYEPGVLPPYEVATILRSTGLKPMGPAVRRGPTYVMHAIDNGAREFRVVFAARTGDILSVTPLAPGSAMMPPRGGVTMGPYERMPPRYAPPGAYGGLIDDDDDLPPPRNYGTRPPAAIPGTPQQRSTYAVPPSRGGASVPDDDEDGSQPPAGAYGTPSDRDRSAMLPPPPERFPQRVSPPTQPKPKPVTRAAAAPPKQAPLPKSKPAAETAAPPQSWPTNPPAAQPTTPPAPAQAAPPAAEETPH